MGGALVQHKHQLNAHTNLMARHYLNKPRAPNFGPETSVKFKTWRPRNFGENSMLPCCDAVHCCLCE